MKGEKEKGKDGEMHWTQNLLVLKVYLICGLLNIGYFIKDT